MNGRQDRAAGLEGVELLSGDARQILSTLPAAYANCCVTSPPYWRQRDYGTPGQIGLEPTIDDYVDHLVAVFAELRRVLTTTATIWLNLGDSYIGHTSGPRVSPGTRNGRPNAITPSQGCSAKRVLQAKNLAGIPWRVALALQERLGLTMRADIIWHKPNGSGEDHGATAARRIRSHRFVHSQCGVDLTPPVESGANAIRRGRASWKTGAHSPARAREGSSGPKLRPRHIRPAPPSAALAEACCRDEDEWWLPSLSHHPGSSIIKPVACSGHSSTTRRPRPGRRRLDHATAVEAASTTLRAAAGIGRSEGEGALPSRPRLWLQAARTIAGRPSARGGRLLVSASDAGVGKDGGRGTPTGQQVHTGHGEDAIPRRRRGARSTLLTVRVDIVVVSGPDGQELEAAQVAAIGEVLEWLRRRPDRQG